MTTTYHTAIANGAAGNASTFNNPLGQLDAQITTNAAAIAANALLAAATTAEVVAARGSSPDLDARLDALVLAGGNVATKANGVSAAGQKVLTVDATTGFIVGAYVVYPLNGSATLQGNIIASINAGVSLVLTDDIGATPAGGVLDDSYISMISISEYLAAQAIPHAGTLLLPETMEYANGEVYNVKAYGAIGNGTTDDTIAIQAAITAAGAAGGGTIRFPKAIYKTTTTLVLADNIVIDGMGSTIKMYHVGNPNVFTLDNLSYVTVRDLTIDGSNTTYAVDAHGAFDVEANLNHALIENVRILNWSGCGFVLSGNASDVTIRGCYVYRCYEHGFYLGGITGDRGVIIDGNVVEESGYGSGGATNVAFKIDNCSRSVVSSNLVINATSHAFLLQNDNTGTRIVNNVVVDAAGYALAAAAGCTGMPIISGNYLSTTYGTAVFFDGGTRLQFVDNEVFGPSGSVLVYVNYAIDNGIISNNALHGSGANSIGIWLVSAVGAIVTGNSIDGLDIGILLSAASRNNICYPNIIINSTYLDVYNDGIGNIIGERVAQASIPTTGTHTIGEIVWHNDAASGETIGWQCTESGTVSAATDSTGDTDGSTAVITGMTDTADFRVGEYVDVSAGFPSTGPYRIISKTATTLTLATASNAVATNVTVDTSDPVWTAMPLLA